MFVGPHKKCAFPVSVTVVHAFKKAWLNESVFYYSKHPGKQAKHERTWARSTESSTAIMEKLKLCPAVMLLRCQGVWFNHLRPGGKRRSYNNIRMRLLSGLNRNLTSSLGQLSRTWHESKNWMVIAMAKTEMHLQTGKGLDTCTL